MDEKAGEPPNPEPPEHPSSAIRASTSSQQDPAEMSRHADTTRLETQPTALDAGQQEGVLPTSPPSSDTSG